MPEPRAVGKATRSALDRHSEESQAILESGDSASIKQIYVDLAASLVEATDADGSVPVLSFHETAAAVAAGLATTSGLHLDVGCGPNPVASILVAKSSGRAIIGADIGTGMITLARRISSEAGVTFCGVVTDAEALPFAPGAFGSVVCDDTIEHLPDDDAGARELARVTAPGGIVALATPNRIRLPVVVKKLRDRVRGNRRPAKAYYAADSHLREYTWRDLEQLVEPHMQVSERGFVPWSGSRARRLASAVTSVPGGRQLGRVVLLFLTPRV
ncbi:class I SAM-dependent methyltransferase [Actinospongicola halichondriae]|uniref:class I SAM-dependent methyltransferase n=1 Tax=Actinospongicola halichondriae TaxID=3236844 RepID=UPI003D48CB13